jgi:hypothetical protein
MAKQKTLFGGSGVYTKVHKLKQAADAHARKIKARGGSVKREKVGSKIKLTYKF